MSTATHAIVAHLVAARKNLGLTQEQVAAKAGVTRMTIQRIEAGGIDPRLSSLEGYAAAVMCEVNVQNLIVGVKGET